MDFTEFEIAAPFYCGGTYTCVNTDGAKIGDCLYDTFTVTAPGKASRIMERRQSLK